MGRTKLNLSYVEVRLRPGALPRPAPRIEARWRSKAVVNQDLQKLSTSAGTLNSQVT